MGIITSLLDTDLYKLTMQKAILGYRQGVPVRYVFNNRRPEGKFNTTFMAAFRAELEHMESLYLKPAEADFLRSACPYLGEEYISYLYNYSFNPREVTAELTDGGELVLSIDGPWERTILWEVPLMALISELFFTYCDTNWTFDHELQYNRLIEKARLLRDAFTEGFASGKAVWSANFADFGTRRRRNYVTQNLVVETFKHWSNFVGTSNVHLAKIHGVKPLGTMAHEWVMGISALEGLQHANRYAMRVWADVYKGNLGTALPDTFGTAAFWEDFDGFYARLFDGVRHDSGDPSKFGHATIEHYKKLGINPMTRTIIFSDGLDAETAAALRKEFHEKINVSFGIGTNLTNDYTGSKPLNMVIKMSHCGGKPVVKLSDVPTKAIGDKDALRVAKWTFFGTPLDEAT